MAEFPQGCLCKECLIAAGKGSECPAGEANREALAEARRISQEDGQTRDALIAHSCLLGRGSSQWPRLKHIAEFSLAKGITHVGLAPCSMFLQHAHAAADYLREKGIRSTVVCCKVGKVRLNDYGIDRKEVEHYVLCNPVGQACIFNEHETEMNVLLGLCAPHDMILGWHAKAPCTTLFTKEYISNHAPFATMDSMVKGKRL